MPSLPKTITQRINRLAHRLALAHEQHVKSELVAQLMEARTGGASFEALNKMLDRLETPTT